MKTVGTTRTKLWNLRSFAFSVAAVFSLSIVLSACGSESNNSGVALPPPTTGVVGQNSCVPGQIYNAQYGCLYQQSCQAGYGWVPGQNVCVPGTTTGTTSTAGANFYTSLTIINRQTFASLLQGSGQCDPHLIGWDWGWSSCDSYSSVGYMIMQIPGAVVNGTLPAQANIWIVAGSATRNSYNPNWTTGGATRTLSAVTNLALANNSNGFTGTPMNTMPGGFRFVVNNGFPSTSYQLDVELQYNGTVFAKGTLTRD